MTPVFEGSLGIFSLLSKCDHRSWKIQLHRNRSEQMSKTQRCCGSLLSRVEEMQTLYIECSLTKFLYVIFLN